MLNMDPIGEGIKRCPFLRELASREGVAFARGVALDPLRQFRPREQADGLDAAVDGVVGHSLPLGRRRPVFEELENFSRTFRVFHGPDGIVPLPKKAAAAAPLERTETAGGEERAGDQLRRQPAVEEAVAQGGGEDRVTRLRTKAAAAAASPPPLLPAPASMSMSNFGFLPGFGNFFDPNKRKQRNDRGQQKRRDQQSGKRSQRPRPRGKGSGPIGISASAPGPLAPDGQCPMRRIFGPMSLHLMKGQLHCPGVIVKMRAALNRTQLVKTLRPQDLPIKILAIAATAAALNIPFGALRQHCVKFSPEWFLVVHATIPLVAMFRKAVIMPKFAMVFTIAAAIGGQMVGARLERKRLISANVVEKCKLDIFGVAEETETQREYTGAIAPMYGLSCSDEVKGCQAKDSFLVDSVLGPVSV